MNPGGFSPARLAHMRQVMEGHVAGGAMPGLVTLVHRRGSTHVEAIGQTAFEGGTPMARDTIFRIASMTKPITAVAAMILVEECRLRLDDPVDPWLPELADRRVLTSIGAKLTDTVPAERPVTLRDLLTFRLGIGAIMARPGTYPIQHAMDAAGLSPGPWLVSDTPDAWMAKLGALPLVHQPGEAWMYHTGAEVLGVLIARASGRSLPEFMDERIFTPLGMKDTGFHVPAEKLHRLPRAYAMDHAAGKVAINAATDAGYDQPRAFPSGGGGLVSTADDYLAFCRMMLDKGVGPSGRILSRPSVDLMTSDQLTPEQRAGAAMFFGDSASWGFGMSVCIRRSDLWVAPGRFGWDGGFGTSGHSDPAEDLVGVLLTQRHMDSPEPPKVFTDFWTSAYASLND